MYDDLNNKNILVVGASRGIGKQLVNTLNEFGSNIYACARNIDDLESLKNNVSNIVSVHHLDLTSDDSISKFCQDIPEMDGIAIVSGVVKIFPPHMLSRKSAKNMIETNFTGSMSLIGHLLKYKKIKAHGSIVFTSAGARHNQVNASQVYAATKSGLSGFVKTLAADLSKNKINVNAVSFDYVQSEMIESFINEELAKDIIEIMPIEFTSFYYTYLLSDKSRYMTGQIISAESGRMLSKYRYE